MSTENKHERVVVITGGADNGAETARMLAGKVSSDDYEVLTRDEASMRGLLPELAPYPSKPRGHSPKPHAERDAWNAAVEAKKAAKRGRKAAP